MGAAVAPMPMPLEAPMAAVMLQHMEEDMAMHKVVAVTLGVTLNGGDMGWGQPGPMVGLVVMVGVTLVGLPLGADTGPRAAMGTVAKGLPLPHRDTEAMDNRSRTRGTAVR